MGDELDRGFENVSRSVKVLGVDLLESCILKPYCNQSEPITQSECTHDTAIGKKGECQLWLPNHELSLRTIYLLQNLIVSTLADIN